LCFLKNRGGFLEELISRYGYAAIFIFTFFEGESVLIAAGFLAFNGYLDTVTIILVSALASYIGHGTFFLIAFFKRDAFLRLIQRFVKVNLKKLEYLVERFGAGSIFISQWIYGFRLLTAAVLGFSGMRRRKYFFFLLISCLLWATICTIVGYFFGAALKNLLGDVKKYSHYIAIGVVVAGFVIWFIRDLNKRRNTNSADTKR
jgi:membrane protein DedA with SNARE-associated domain